MGRRVDRRARAGRRRAAESQPRLPAALDQAVIRVQSQGNEMIVMRQAPVAYSTIEQIYAGIGSPRKVGPVPLRIVRASPAEEMTISSASPAAALSFSASASTRRWTARARPCSRGPGRPQLSVAEGSRGVALDRPGAAEPRGDGDAPVSFPVAWPLESLAVSTNG